MLFLKYIKLVHISFLPDAQTTIFALAMIASSLQYDFILDVKQVRPCKLRILGAKRRPNWFKGSLPFEVAAQILLLIIRRQVNI